MLSFLHQLLHLITRKLSNSTHRHQIAGNLRPDFAALRKIPNREFTRAGYVKYVARPQVPMHNVATMEGLVGLKNVIDDLQFLFEQPRGIGELTVLSDIG